MKEYKRLTKRDGKEVKALGWDGEVLHRLAELGDKIENGDLISPCDMGYNEIAFFVKHNAEVRKGFAKEFSEKVREKALSHCKTINCYELTFIEETIDKLLKEHEK